MSRLIALDFESTDLLDDKTEDPHMQPGITEIGAVCVEHDHGKWIDCEAFTTLVNPEMEISAKASELTGITQEDVNDKKNLRSVFIEFAAFMCGADTLITYNGAYFDIPLLRYNLMKYGIETRFPWPYKQIDVMLVATDVMNIPSKRGNKYPKLGELHEFLFDKPIENAHRAVHDAQATMNCAMKLVEQGRIKL